MSLSALNSVRPTLVVALGGNALLRKGEPLTAENQRRNIEVAAAALADLAADYRLVVVHGNGPQVGLLALQNLAHDSKSPFPLDVLVAETQGMIGYLLQRALARRLPDEWGIATILTQVEVDSSDPAFENPTKPIGPVYNSKEDADWLSKEHGWTMRPEPGGEGKGFRRVVPSPKPLSVVERHTIQETIRRDRIVVICCGGGGVPVFQGMPGFEGSGEGAEAVVDKDLCASLLATQIRADGLLILTEADGVYADYGKPGQRLLRRVGAEELAALGPFDAGSMGPKVAACINFVEQTKGKGRAFIGALEDSKDIFNGTRGTEILLGSLLSRL